MNIICRVLTLFEIVWAYKYELREVDMDKKFLDLSDPEITELSDNIKKCEKLEILRIDGTGIISLPPVIGELKNLKQLTIFNNSELKSLPKELFNCLRLERLSISNNYKLASLPEELFNCSRLITLNLSNNKLTSLSDKIGKLGVLEELNLDSNNLELLPAELCKCLKLKDLRIRENKPTSLPDEVGNLVNLETLNLGHNKLTTLPYKMVELSLSIKSLYLNGNEIVRSGITGKTLGRKELENLFKGRVHF